MTAIRAKSCYPDRSGKVKMPRKTTKHGNGTTNPPLWKINLRALIVKWQHRWARMHEVRSEKIDDIRRKYRPIGNPRRGKNRAPRGKKQDGSFDL